ncbi:MAG: exopolysaccharide biosynthesis polyprenyl glycosylphosphotransferase [Bdellovibrionales bacterium]|nr:exopolysaccharide biosynthesis polyprenyl glycosylphosphotransferase [Bdellovibrionales bacterium]
MLKSYHQFFRVLFQVLDAVWIARAFLASFWIRFHWRPSFLPEVFGPIPSLDGYLTLLPGLVLIWFLCLQISGAYKVWRFSSQFHEMLSLLKATFLAFLGSIVLIHFFARDDYSRGFLMTFFGLAFVSLALSRTVLRLTLKALRRRGTNLRHVLFIGDERMALPIQSGILARPELGIRSQGLLWTAEKPKTMKDVGPIQCLEDVLASHGVDQVVICLPMKQWDVLGDILGRLALTNVHVRVVPDLSQFSVLGFEIEDFEGVPVVTLNQSPLVGWNRILKRISDIVYATFALLLFSPVMLVSAALIKLTSRGPVFYFQERMGLDGVIFKMWKFRSMRTDAETETGAVWAKQNDQRVTWIGALLRKTSLDELPQLFNVLRGDMSCVGPRPERPVFVKEFSQKIPGYMLRHKMKAGMTGWAQINGLRRSAY